MNRRSLIFCLTALAAMVVMIVVAVAFLYRDDKEQAPAASRYSLAHAVPSNAVAVCFLSEAEDISSTVLTAFDFPARLAEFMTGGGAGVIADNPMALSLHYAGTLAPLYVFDVGEASSEVPAAAAELMELAADAGFVAAHVDCSKEAAGSPLSSRSLVLVAKTNTTVSSALNHLRGAHSILDAQGFGSAADSAPENALFISYAHAKPLFEKAFSRMYFKNRYDPKDVSRKYSAMASFVSSLADWTVVEMDSPQLLDIFHSCDGVTELMHLVQNASPSLSKVSQVLPSYTCFALAVPMADCSAYLRAYVDYLSAVQLKNAYDLRKASLKRNYGVDPDKFISCLGVNEVATASFYCGNTLHSVNLLKVEHADAMLLRKTGRDAFPTVPEVLPYAYPSYVAAVFGDFFSLPDESHFTYMNGWVITGSRAAVEEYVSGMALEYDLKTYMSDAGRNDLLASRASSYVAYLNMQEDDRFLATVLSKDMSRLYGVFRSDAQYSPVVMSVYEKGGRACTDIQAFSLSMNRMRAPRFERDVNVVVPTGPFKVFNSGTGRTNIFYQNSSGAICLKEEDGTGLWGVPFKHALCGTAHNIDYYANGNKQILFGAGSSIYLIDRLGRFVQGFPSDLGKDILLGPDVYDFNGVNSYRVMVLHKDNTIEMYDLKGQKPVSWQGIKAPETVVSLPERIILGENSFWVVRTSIQTLIYPFYGGAPLTDFRNDQMILPSGEVKVRNSTSVEVECYDGVRRTVKLK